jgi:hypothetical protein
MFGCVFIEWRCFTLGYFDGTLRAPPKTSAKTVAIYLGNQAGLAVNDLESTLCT